MDKNNMFSADKHKTAFTLAEVLITLAIIGIVAAMTIPNLIANYQKNLTITRLKKAYSEINQAIRISQTEFGTLDSWAFSNFDSMLERNSYFAQNYLYPNIKILKDCTPASEECRSKIVYNIDGSAFQSSFSSKHNAFVTSSGYSVYYWLHETGTGGWFYIDINGLKKPNTLGKDVFPFLMSWGNCKINGVICGLNPVGLNTLLVQLSREDLIDGNIQVTSANFNCKKGSGLNGAGGYCGALIMYDGWKISDDYPW